MRKYGSDLLRSLVRIHLVVFITDTLEASLLVLAHESSIAWRD